MDSDVARIRKRSAGREVDADRRQIGLGGDSGSVAVHIIEVDARGGLDEFDGADRAVSGEGGRAGRVYRDGILGSRERRAIYVVDLDGRVSGEGLCRRRERNERLGFNRRRCAPRERHVSHLDFVRSGGDSLEGNRTAAGEVVVECVGIVS